MPDILKPNFNNGLWASGGAIVAPSDVKIATGWTAEVPPFQWENYSQNRQDQGIAHILQHGISTWDSLTEYQAGRSYVQGSDGFIYKAIQTATNQNPVADISFVYWSKAFSGGLLAFKSFSSPGTFVYTPTPGTRFVIVNITGGGGGGGGCGPTGPNQVSGSVGGCGGGTARKLLTTGFSGATVTIGVAGTGGAPAVNGVAGGTSSFGGVISAGGGGGGQGYSATAGLPAYQNSGVGANQPGIGTGGDANMLGGYATTGMQGNLVTSNGVPSQGGSSIYGAGGTAAGDTEPSSATVPGAGGSGVCRAPNLGGISGGNGAAGRCEIWEYS